METKDKKQYITPKVIFETDLEVKAGTPIGIIPPPPGGVGPGPDPEFGD